jgi:hypothetical protein
MIKILSLVMNSALAAALALPMLAQTAPAAAAPAARTAKSTATAAKAVTAAAPTAQEIADAQSKGLVWANTSSKVYHTSGAFYGKTRHGKFMTREEAEKAGFKAAKEPAAKKNVAKVSKTPKK